MKNLITIFLVFTAFILNAQTFSYKGYDYNIKDMFTKQLKFSTVYGAVNGGTSMSDVKTFSITSGQLEEDLVETPYDYSLTIGIRKIARFGYENRANTFYDGTESNYTDAATVGKVKGFEYLFEIDYARQQGIDYLDQHHFIRYSSDDDCDGPLCVNHFAAKIEYLKDMENHYNKRRKVLENSIKRCKNSMTSSLLLTGKNKIQTSDFNFSLGKSKKWSVNEELINEEQRQDLINKELAENLFKVKLSNLKTEYSDINNNDIPDWINIEESDFIKVR